MKVVLAIIIALSMLPLPVHAQGEGKQQDVLKQRMALYEKVAITTQVPWYVLAAVDQYEHNIRKSRRDLPKQKGVIGIYIPREMWIGPE
ncbi:peptidase M23, partial [Bacillus pumilus]|nr:peptidase M23 [Bacillus pumilus]